MSFYQNIFQVLQYKEFFTSSIFNKLTIVEKLLA